MYEGLPPVAAAWIPNIVFAARLRFSCIASRRACTVHEARAMIPGRALHRLAACICCAKTLEHVVEPAIADLQKEYASAPSECVRVQGSAGRLCRDYQGDGDLRAPPVCSQPPRIATRSAGRSRGRSAVSLQSTACSSCAALLSRRQSITRWFAATTLVPQAVPLAIPIGIVFGIAFGLSLGRP